MQSKRLWVSLFASAIVAISCQTIQQVSTQKTDAAQENFVQQGNQFAKDGLLREAVDSYKKALHRDPKNVTATRNLGIVLAKAGDYQGAINNLEKSMPEFENNFDANFFLGESYRATDKYAEAIYRYKKALKLQEDEPRSLKSLAWSYYKIRFYSESLNLCQRLQKKYPRDEQAPIIMARTLLKLKRGNEALAILRKGSKLAGGSSQAYYQSVTAEVLYSQGKTEAALETWKLALKAQPLMAGALLGTGQALLEMGKTKEAAEYLERAVRVKPKLYEGYYWLARSVESTNPARALKIFNHFRKNGSNDPEFVEMIQDAKKRSASLRPKINPEDLAN
jgi:tetratricopeptide (TPR) repeat protein